MLLLHVTASRDTSIFVGTFNKLQYRNHGTVFMFIWPLISCLIHYST